jgi:predicted N-formylglutamate amidohydrolase
MADEGRAPVHLENPHGAGPFVLVCDHAANTLPLRYADLGLPPEALSAHIAWDPGALPVSRHLSAALDAPLLWPDASRLIVDCNRDLSAPDLIPATGEGRPVPGNDDLAPAERQRRIATVHAPYHDAIDALLDRRRSAGMASAVVAIHSFTPVFLGRQRPWEIGVLFDDDRRLADPIVAALSRDATLTVGINQPYAPADGVYYTLARHARSRGLPAVMIELRNDTIADPTGQAAWGERLGAILASLSTTVGEGADETA